MAAGMAITFAFAFSYYTERGMGKHGDLKRLHGPRNSWWLAPLAPFLKQKKTHVY